MNKIYLGNDGSVIVEMIEQGGPGSGRKPGSLGKKTLEKQSKENKIKPLFDEVKDKDTLEHIRTQVHPYDRPAIHTFDHDNKGAVPIIIKNGKDQAGMEAKHYDEIAKKHQELSDMHFKRSKTHAELGNENLSRQSMKSSVDNLVKSEKAKAIADDLRASEPKADTKQEDTKPVNSHHDFLEKISRGEITRRPFDHDRLRDKENNIVPKHVIDKAQELNLYKRIDNGQTMGHHTFELSESGKKALGNYRKK